jgi:abortive infection bacteriophage resistance protein
MIYNKPSLSFAEQITLLESRNMVCRDHALLLHWLKTVGYYRLSAYWLYFEEQAPSEKTRSKCFKPNTHFEDIIELYIFDRKLRLLCLEAIERIEIALRTTWVYHLSQHAGAHAHLDSDNFNSGYEHIKSLARLGSNIESNKKESVKHYHNKYQKPYMPAIWVVAETMTFGQLIEWQNITNSQKFHEEVAQLLGIKKDQVYGTLKHLRFVRNTCAHHERVWNIRVYTKLPNIMAIKNSTQEFTKYGGEKALDDRIYNTLVLLIYLLEQQGYPTSFAARVSALLNTMPRQYRTAMGFPYDWYKRPIWQADKVLHNEHNMYKAAL